MKYVHKEKLRRQGFPMESLVGETPIAKFPARVSIAAAADVARVQDLKNPTQTDPLRLTGWAHAKVKDVLKDVPGKPVSGSMEHKMSPTHDNFTVREDQPQSHEEDGKDCARASG